MKNAEVPNLKLWLLAFSFAFLAFTAFGCNGLSRKAGHPNTTSVSNLVPEAIQIIQEGLADDNPRIRASAIEVVAVTKRINLMPKVKRLLKDDFVPVRFLAAFATGELEYQLAKSEVAQLLTGRDENVRIAAAYAMNKLGSADDLELVRKAITSKDQTVRANATVLLGKSDDESVLKLLYWVLKDEDSDDKVRFQAAEAIARLGDEQIYPKLWTMLISAYADDRVMGIRAMGALGTVQAKDALITMLDDDILEVRLAAAEQLGMLGDTTGEPEVLDVFTKKLTAGLEKKDLERVNVLTALAIGQVGTATLTKFLPQFLKNESKFVRIAAAKAVFQCTTKN